MNQVQTKSLVLSVVKKVEHEVRELHVSFGPQKGGCGTLSIFMKFDVWEC